MLRVTSIIVLAMLVVALAWLHEYAYPLFALVWWFIVFFSICAVGFFGWAVKWWLIGLFFGSGWRRSK